MDQSLTFLGDELSVITGPHDRLLSIDEVIKQELILFVTLNVNENTEPLRPLGKMLLQNLQLAVGKHYESETERKCLLTTPTPLKTEMLAEDSVPVLQPHSQQIIGVMWAASWGRHIHKGTFHDSLFPI